MVSCSLKYTRSALRLREGLCLAMKDQADSLVVWISVYQYEGELRSSVPKRVILAGIRWERRVVEVGSYLI